MFKKSCYNWSTTGFALTVLLGLAFLCNITAAELYVPSEYETIQAAIDDCDDGDVVIIAEGTYRGNGNRDIDFRGKAITVGRSKFDDEDAG